MSDKETKETKEEKETKERAEAKAWVSEFEKRMLEREKRYPIVFENLKANLPELEEKLKRKYLKFLFPEAETGEDLVQNFFGYLTAGKPAEVRMGSGKGEIVYWAAVIKPGTILYEIGGLPEPIARQALNRAAHKLPIRLRLIKRRQSL